MEQSEHSNGNSVILHKTITGDNTPVEENIFDDEIDENVRKDLTKTLLIMK